MYTREKKTLSIPFNTKGRIYTQEVVLCLEIRLANGNVVLSKVVLMENQNIYECYMTKGEHLDMKIARELTICIYGFITNVSLRFFKISKSFKN